MVGILILREVVIVGVVTGTGGVYGIEREYVHVLKGQPGQMDEVVVTAMMDVVHGVEEGRIGIVVVVSSQGVVAGGVHFGQVLVVLSSQSLVEDFGHQSKSAKTLGTMATRRTARVEVRMLSSIIDYLNESLGGLLLLFEGTCVVTAT